MKTLARKCSPALAALMLCMVVSGCATMSRSGERESDDPLEPLNRAVLATNTAIDDAIIRPIAESYRKLVPEVVRDHVRAFIDNLAEPRILLNDVLQGRPDAAGITLARFMINTLGGVGGLFDLASRQGYPRQSGDFGQTLDRWGFANGPYLVLLLLGPSNVRDAVGLGVDAFTTPPGGLVRGHSGAVANIAVGTVDGIDLRSRNIETLDEIKAGALDYYAQLKSITQQRREAELREARGIKESPDELLDPAAPAEPPTR